VPQRYFIGTAHSLSQYRWIFTVNIKNSYQF